MMPTEESRSVLTFVSRMYYMDGMGQGEIANIYGVSRSTVSRMLTAAREQGIVRISIDESDPRDRELEQKLINKLGVQKAVVIWSSAKSPEHTRRTVGYFAAPFVQNWIMNSSRVGITGGRTLAEMVRFMSASRGVDGPEFVPLLGAIGSRPRQVDASEQCRTLARQLHGTFRSLSLPAYVENGHVRDLFLAHKDIGSVWQSLHSISLAMVGIGTLDYSVFAHRNLLEPNEVVQLQNAGAVGEICGRFFDARGKECATDLRDRVVGAELDVLRNCPDVAAIVSGPSRGKAVRAAVRSGIVKSIVVDQVGAYSMLEEE